MIKKAIRVDNSDFLADLFGNCDENIHLICQRLGVELVSEKGEIFFRGEKENVDAALEVVRRLNDLRKSGESIDLNRVEYVCDCASEGKLDEIDELLHGAVAITARGKPIKCKTVGQKKYVDALRKNTVIFGIGPAGTGKTYLSVAMAVAAWKAKEVEKIILTRPAVEAGEKLGFLPGDLQEKVNPYLRPLYDALQEMFGLDSYQKFLEKGVIEIAPLAYMRGRTLNHSFLILDEAQNTTKEQMKMFLTRLGEGSKMVINGDLTQIDLPDGKKSGLKHAAAILKNTEGIAVCNFTEKDVVRHPLVQKIVKAYEAAEKKKS